MKKLKIIILFSLVSLFGNAHANENMVQPNIKFQIIDKDNVLVNGKKAAIKKSWEAIDDFVNPEITNFYEISNASDFPDQADEIRYLMDVTSQASGVRFQLSK